MQCVEFMKINRSCLVMASVHCSKFNNDVGDAGDAGDAD